jgi:hypothetical protein
LGPLQRRQVKSVGADATSEGGEEGEVGGEVMAVEEFLEAGRKELSPRYPTSTCPLPLTRRIHSSLKMVSYRSFFYCKCMHY